MNEDNKDGIMITPQIFRIFMVAKSFIMGKHLAPPKYIRLAGVIWVVLLLGGMAIDVSHIHDKSAIMAIYSVLALLIMGALGMFFFRPRT